MIDLQSISSNLLLVGFVLISICCLYLLYANFTKIRELNELKRNVEDLKNIFFNQQKQNDETYNTLINNIKMEQKVDASLDTHTTKETKETTKYINIEDNKNTSGKLPNIIKLTKENIENIRLINTKLNDGIEIIGSNTDHADKTDNKLISIELEDLDDLDNLNPLDTNDLDNDIDVDLDDMDGNDNIDGNIDEIEDNTKFLLNQKVDDNIFDIIHSEKDNEQDTIFNENSSITTEPIVDDLEEANFDIDDLNEINTEEFDNLDDDIGNDIDNDLGNDLDNDINKDTEKVKDNCDIKILETDLDNLDTDFNNLDTDLDNLDTDLDNLEDTKHININNTATLNETIINTKVSNSSNEDTTTKKIYVDNSKDTETVELDKLLSGEIKNINIKQTTNEITTTVNTIYTIDNLNNMSIKQLKDIAKTYKVKTSGTKQELIQAISKSIGI